MNKGKIGEVVEYKAVAWLLQEGYEVYKNVTYHGPIDVIALNTESGELVCIDVKKVVDGERPTTKVSHPRHTSVQQHLGVKFLYYDEKHNLFAWNTADIYANMGKVKQPPTTPQRVTVNAAQFASLAAAATYYGVKDRTVREWMRRHPLCTLEEAINHALVKQKKVIVRGEQFPNKKQACDRFGVSQRTVEYWHYEKGLSFEEAINESIRREHSPME